jgi:hypothetical protein
MITSVMRPAGKKRGTVKMGQSCIYVNHLSDLNMPTLKQLIRVR